MVIDPALKIIECPRDAMQGIKEWIPTEVKLAYIQGLLEVGFDSLDFGSFVSPKAVPQMKDSKDIYESLDLSNTQTKLLAIVANKRGAETACQLDKIQYLGFPFSISETFQLRNTNTTIAESLKLVEELQNLCIRHNKTLVTYISMGFGNPYGDPWNAGIVMHWTEALKNLGATILSLSDTIGVSTPDNIAYLFSHLISEYPDIEFGAHLHTLPDMWREKVEAAFLNGCRRFDGAIKGYGGCPMAKDDLTGNMPTEKMLSYFSDNKLETGLNMDLFNRSIAASAKVFPH